ncbi:diguanylate cyclase [Shewanella sp. JM162201]|uniref:Diguanylate cyclase n=1 Tax=Shewanella jiangmenensis TaxID=2837387 RepID=A0ABS5V989_9GAMM|nr:diguanylate cyclase [Shewanella jiangmenensis]MBT1446525.1 diguanylate cyclase [Shewanella jiangmenensis]
MEFHQRICCALLWLLPWFACASDPLDDLNTLVYQYPAEANKKLLKLEEEFRSHKPEPFKELRLKILRCEALLQMGENEAAINMAQTGEAIAKQLRAEHVRPYFMSCLADAYSSYDNLQIALPQLDSAITLAKRYQQPQALVTALRLRGQIDTENDNFTSAIEDLRLALDVYDSINIQEENWAWPPKAYVQAAMGNLLYATGDTQQAMYYMEQGLKSPEAKGKIRQVLLLNAAKIAFHQGNTEASDRYLKEARTLLPELSSALELAISYSIIASIEIERGRAEKARELLEVALNTFEQQQKQVHSMRTRKLLADVAFASGDDKTALALMEKAIRTAQQMQVYSDLANYQLALAKYYADQNEYKRAYQYLDQSYQAANKANANTNHTRVLQFKARLSQRTSDATLEKVLSDNLQDRRNINWMYLFLLTMVVLLLSIVIWQLMRHMALRKAMQVEPAPQTPQQHLESAMQHAKRGNHSLSILLLNVREVDPVELPELKLALEKRLRETDMIFRHSGDELLILLPYTSNQGAELVMEQLTPELAKFSDGKNNLGHACMHQFDTAETLIKRATTRGMSRAQLDGNSPAR